MAYVSKSGIQWEFKDGKWFGDDDRFIIAPDAGHGVREGMASLFDKEMESTILYRSPASAKVAAGNRVCSEKGLRNNPVLE